MTIAIVHVAGSAALEQLAQLFREYAAQLGVELCFQGFEQELAGLPGQYAEPAGVLLMARDGAGAPLGCVGVRPLDTGRCELKRLYVRPEGRGQGLGRRLVTEALRIASARGYRSICLDTLASMRTAMALYEALGFRDIPPYNDNPIAEVRFMGRGLDGLIG